MSKEKEYLCSEKAVQKILREKGIFVDINILKKCEALEKMINCIPEEIEGVKCEFSDVSNEELKETLPTEPIAIRIKPKGQQELHTINVVGYDKGHFIINDEDDKNYIIPESKFEELRSDTKGFNCKKSDEEMNNRLLLNTLVETFGSPGIVVNPEVAKATSCTCYRLDGKFMCFSKGIIGALSQEQKKIYCPTIVEKESPALKERIRRFREAAEEAHKKIEHLPKGERLEPWLTEMGKELRKREIEI